MSEDRDLSPPTPAWGIPTLTDHAVNRAEENRALCWRGCLAQVLHDQGAVTENVDELSQVGQSHLLQVLTLLVGGGRAEMRSARLRMCWGTGKLPQFPPRCFQSWGCSSQADMHLHGVWRRPEGPVTVSLPSRAVTTPQQPAHLSFWHTNKLKAFSAPKKLSSSRISTALIQFGLKSRAIWKGTGEVEKCPDGSSSHPQRPGGVRSVPLCSRRSKKGTKDLREVALIRVALGTMPRHSLGKRSPCQSHAQSHSSHLKRTDCLSASSYAAFADREAATAALSHSSCPDGSSHPGRQQPRTSARSSPGS